MKGSGRSLI